MSRRWALSSHSRYLQGAATERQQLMAKAGRALVAARLSLHWNPKWKGLSGAVWGSSERGAGSCRLLGVPSRWPTARTPNTRQTRSPQSRPSCEACAFDRRWSKAGHFTVSSTPSSRSSPLFLKNLQLEAEASRPELLPGWRLRGDRPSARAALGCGSKATRGGVSLPLAAVGPRCTVPFAAARTSTPSSMSPVQDGRA